MSRLKEITSTEKLLDIIRNKKNDVNEPVGSSNVDPPKKRLAFTASKIISVQKSVTIGIDIGHKHLRLVKTAKLADNRWELLAHKSVPIIPTSSVKSTEYINFLKSEITEFCGDCSNANLWAIMSAAKVNVRHIHIPKVAKKQIENAVYWTIKKETPFDEKDTIFDFEIQGEVTEQGIPKWLTMVYTAPREEVEEIKGMFSRMGLPLTGVSITPFAIQNIYKTGWIPEAVQGTIAGLFIGNDFSRIDIYAKGKLIMTRGIKAGINSMVESLLEKLTGPWQGIADIGGKRPPVNVEHARKILFSLSPDSPPLTEGEAGFDLTYEEKFETVLPALERVIRQVERTFEYYSATLNYDRVTKIYVSSAMNISQPIIEYIGNQLGIESDVPDPASYTMPGITKNIEEASVSERLAFIPALGLSISDNTYTPNLLFRFKDKEKATNVLRINHIILMAFIIAVFISSGLFMYQVQEASQKEAVIAGLEKQLSQYKPRVDQNIVSQVVASAGIQQKISNTYSDRYLGMAIVNELSLLTPANIRLTNLKAHLGAVPVGKETAKKESVKEDLKNVVVEGIVFGDRRVLESSLAGYIMKLEASPMFRQITVQKNSIEPFKKSDVLRFVIDMKIG